MPNLTSSFISLRYLKSKPENRFISLTTSLAVVGITIGVMVLITVSSVMNGFDYEIRKRLYDMTEQITLKPFSSQLENWDSIQKTVLAEKHVTAAFPYINGYAMISYRNQSTPISVVGILPDVPTKLPKLARPIATENVNLLEPGSFNVIMADVLAHHLGLVPGNKFILITPSTSITPIGLVPKLKQVTLAATFTADGKNKYETQVLFTNLADAQKLFNFNENNVSGLGVLVDDLYIATEVSQKLRSKLPIYSISDWTDEYRPLFESFKMQKIMFIVVLSLIVLIATFNLVSGLVMLAIEKKSDIAVLRSLGMKTKDVMLIFIIQGGIIGLTSIVIGSGLGILLAKNITYLASGLEKILGTEFVSESVFLFNFLPSKIHWMDVVIIAVLTFVLSLIATIYPARWAAKILPAQVLRYN